MTTPRRAVLVIGDVMLDRRVEGEMIKVSPEAPTPVVKQHEVTETLGGAGNVARNIVSLGGFAYLMGVVGADAAGQRVTQLAAEAGLPACLPTGIDGPTTQKTRITCGGQLVMRTDDESGSLSADEGLLNGLPSVLNDNTDVVLIVISDYAKGAVTEPVLQRVRELAVQYNIPIYVDCRPADCVRYRGVTLLKPNLKEAMGMMEVLGEVHPGLYTDDVFSCGDTATALLKRRLELDWVLVTMSRHGCTYYDPADQRTHSFSPRAREVYDVCGAGDTTLAALAVAYLEGKPASLAVPLAMYAAGLAVRRHGVHAIKRDDVEEFRYRETGWAAKLMDFNQLQWFIARRRRMGHRIVVTNGCYDGIHSGHIEMFRFASQQGDTLIVAYNDDESLRELKGAARPWVPQSYRASHLAQQECIDAVIRFDGDAEKLIRGLKPDVLVKGEDSMKNHIPGADFVASRGGVLALAPIKFNLSSSLAGAGDKLDTAPPDGFPWCDACQSYHHPDNPTCRLRQQ